MSTVLCKENGVFFNMNKSFSTMKDKKKRAGIRYGCRLSGYLMIAEVLQALRGGKFSGFP